VTRRQHMMPPGCMMTGPGRMSCASWQSSKLLRLGHRPLGLSHTAMEGSSGGVRVGWLTATAMMKHSTCCCTGEAVVL
jgi:hypothetical protein